MAINQKKLFFYTYGTIQKLQDQLQTSPDISEQESAAIRINLAIQYITLGDPDTACSYLKEALLDGDEFKNPQNPNIEIQGFIILFFSFIQQNLLYDGINCIDTFRKKLMSLTEDSIVIRTAIMYSDLIQSILNETPDTYTKSINKLSELENFYYEHEDRLPKNFIVSLNELYALSYSHQKNLDKAVNYMQKALQIAKEELFSFRENIIYRYISGLYERFGMYKESLEYYEKYCEGRDFLWQAKDYAYSEFLIAQYGITQKQKEVSELEEVNSSLTEKVFVDALTQIYNRRFLTRLLSEHFPEKMLNPQRWSAIMLDIDFFKGYNDSYGHLQGDHILIAIGKILKDSSNALSFPIRYGGEEFLVLLQDTSVSEAEKIAQKILQQIRDMKIFHPCSAVSEFITMSAGVAEQDCLSIDDIHVLCEKSDQALYLSKNSGRNKCSVYTGER